uniref:Cytochrome P450 n=1 Tax=Romanomermis culicivorax TaxID=13658 RepID=A0A915L4J9_ROMCU
MRRSEQGSSRTTSPFALKRLMQQSSDDITTLVKWAKIYGPLYKFYIGRKLILVLADYDAIEQSLIKQGEVFSGRPIFNALYTQKFHGKRTGFLLTDGECWREQRRFALSTMRDCGMGKSSLQQSVAEAAEVLLKELEVASFRKSVDILDSFNKAVGNVICSMAFGRTFEGEEFWRQLKLINFRVSESGIWPPFNYMVVQSPGNCKIDNFVI